MDHSEALTQLAEKLKQTDDYVKIFGPRTVEGAFASSILASALFKEKKQCQVQLTTEKKAIQELKKAQFKRAILLELDILEDVPKDISATLITKKTRSGAITLDLKATLVQGCQELAEAINPQNDETADLAIIDAIAKGKETDVKLITIPDLFEAKTLPLYKALTYCTQPFIPTITGNETAATHLCKEAKIPLKLDGKPRTLFDLEPEEQKELMKEIEKRQPLPIQHTRVYKDEKDLITLTKTCIETKNEGLALTMLLQNKKAKSKAMSLFVAEQKEFITLLTTAQKQLTNQRVSCIRVEQAKERHIERLLAQWKAKEIILLNRTIEGTTQLIHTTSTRILQEILPKDMEPQRQITLSESQEAEVSKNCQEKLQDLILEEKIK